jgi:protein ImuA
MPATKQDTIDRLRKEILLLQGFQPPSAATVDMGLGPVMTAFPGSVFPTGAIHELVAAGPQGASVTGGFVAGLMASLMRSGSAALWISCKRRIFPPALKVFGIEPDHIIFIDLRNEQEVLWATEEALKCEGLAAVVGEIKELDFTASRRIQLAVEQSRVTGFILRHDPRYLNTTASVARWKIGSLPSKPIGEMPGLGFPRWNIELERIRNGHPGNWQLEWSAGRFQVLTPEIETRQQALHRKTG